MTVITVYTQCNHYLSQNVEHCHPQKVPWNPVQSIPLIHRGKHHSNFYHHKLACSVLELHMSGTTICTFLCLASFLQHNYLGFICFITCVNTCNLFLWLSDIL